MENKKQHSKGLTDKELTAKYESGRFHLAKAIKSTLEVTNHSFAGKPNQGKK